jgi:hypothetical protein
VTSPVEPMERRVFRARELMDEHPPVLRDANKLAVFKIACPPRSTHGGQLVYTRWKAVPLPDFREPSQTIGTAVLREGFYDYAPASGDSAAVEWHVNFADPELFVAYGSRLFAQDEMQVAEHPVLGALKEALYIAGARARTEEGGQPTPILIAGAERRCMVATDPNPAEGRTRGLYGNAFGAAPVETVRRATTRIDPPTVTNLIAIAAPSGGRGLYSAEEIERILTTAFSGFRAAVAESGSRPAVVHTGFWGCGAFGGNRVLMAMLQVIASRLAGVKRLEFHSVGAAGREAFDSALRLIEEDLDTVATGSRALSRRIAAMGFEWGTSDGN